MAMYTPSKGGTADGKCSCGKPAVTEVQCGYDPGANYGPNHPANRIGGGQYDEMCQACYDDHVEYARENGQCYPDGSLYSG